jgi:hypothetical protein
MTRKDTVPLVVTAAGFVVASLLLLLCATRCGKYVVAGAALHSSQCWITS